MKSDDVNRLIDQRQVLAQPVDAVNISQEPVDETAKCKHEPLYMDMSQVPTGIPDWKPGMVFPAPKKEWVGLTDEEIQAERHKLDQTAGWTYDHFARAIEAKLKEKNT